MDLSKISNLELLGRLEKLVRTERKITHLILCHINEFESRKLYAEMGFDSVFKYLTQHLGYGEDSAYRRLQAARLLKSVPQAAGKIEDGSLNLTQLTQVQKCIRQESKNGNQIAPAQTLQILEQIQDKSSFETQKVLAVEFNQPIQKHEVMKPQRDDTIRLEFTITSEQMKILEQAMDLLSHVVPDRCWAELFTHLAEKQVRKSLGKDSSSTFSKEVLRSESSDSFQGNLAAAASTPSFTAARKRKAIKITTKRMIYKNAQGCCEYINPKTQHKCNSTYQLQVDHKVPVAFGGTNESQNLRILCRTHNLLAAKQWEFTAR
ncbi:HNH endonuclease [Bdellovibrio sp. HCB2-146]|uniref:HNH endonuclease n=1 Tax=Bdellovibrio sp. HCB2-146 TaxID=3394362 RepID=UPI0039BC586B